MCALLLKPHDAHRRDRWWERPIHGFFRLFNCGFDALGARLRLARGARRAVRGARCCWSMPAILAFGLNEFRKTPTGFIPQLDRGYLIVVVQLPPGASLSRTDEVSSRAVDIALKTPGVAHAVNIVGFSGATFTNAPNAGAIFLVLEPFEQRAKDPRSSPPTRITGELFGSFAPIQEALVLRGAAAAGRRHRQCRRLPHDGRGPRRPRLAGAAAGDRTRMMARAGADAGHSRRCSSLFETSTPQLYLDIDRTKAQLLGINVADVFAALQVYIGSSYVNDFNLFGRTFRVTAQADAPFRNDPQDVLKLRVRNSTGETVPLGSFTTVRDISGPYRVPRYNLYPAAELDGAAAPGYSPGPGDRHHGEARRRDAAGRLRLRVDRRSRSSRSAPATRRASPSRSAVVFVFLVLAAQFESLTLPLAVILIVPMCLVASISGVILRGQDNNILTQVGFVVLIGLAAKNAILIVEFAKQLEDRGPRPLRGGGRGGAAAAAADPDDLVRLHLRRRAAGVGDRRRRRAAPDARHRGVLRHDRRHRVRPDLHAGVLRGLPLDGGACQRLRGRGQAQAHPAE